MTLFESMVSSACCFAYLIPIGLGVFLFVLWIIALIDVIQRDDRDFPQARRGMQSANERLIWILVVIFAHGLGAIIYYFLVMKPCTRSRA